METDSEDPKFPDARAAETPESASVEHLATRSTGTKVIHFPYGLWNGILIFVF